MPNDNFFKDDNVRVGTLTPVSNSAIAPLLPVNQISSAMLFAAADPNTKLKITKEALHDSCRAMLAYSAMENVLTLSAIADHCTRVSPSGEQRYKYIADAYTAAAANRIVRW